MIFSWTSFPYTIRLMPVYIKICIFFPKAWFSRWRLLNFNQKVFQTVKSKEYPCDKNKKVTKTNGYFSTDVRLGGEVSLNDIIIPKTHHSALGFYMTYISKSSISLEIKIFSNIYWHIGGSNCFLTRSLQESNGLILMIFSAFFEDKPGTDASSWREQSLKKDKIVTVSSSLKLSSSLLSPASIWLISMKSANIQRSFWTQFVTSQT